MGRSSAKLLGAEKPPNSSKTHDFCGAFGATKNPVFVCEYQWAKLCPLPWEHIRGPSPPPPLNSISGGYTVKWWWGMWPGCLGMLPFQLFYESPSFPDLLRSPSQNFDSLIKVLTCFAGDSQGIFLDTFWWKRQNWTSRMFLNQFFVNICGVWRVLDKLIFLSIIFEKYRWTRPTRRKVAQKSIKS